MSEGSYPAVADLNMISVLTGESRSEWRCLRLLRMTMLCNIKTISLGRRDRSGEVYFLRSYIQRLDYQSHLAGFKRYDCPDQRQVSAVRLA